MRTRGSFAKLGTVIVLSGFFAAVGCGSPMPPPPAEQGTSTPDRGAAQAPVASPGPAPTGDVTPPTSSPDAGAQGPAAAPPPAALPTCPPEPTTCAGEPTNLHTDGENCGQCAKACAAGDWCSGGTCWSSAQRASVLDAAKSLTASVDRASQTTLSDQKPDYQFVAGDETVVMKRLSTAVTSTIASPLSPRATFEIAAALFEDSTRTSVDFHVAESLANPYSFVGEPDAPLLSHVYAYGLVDTSNPARPKHLSGLNTTGAGITITLPCDKATQCAACGCSCGCFLLRVGALSVSDAWTTAGVSTVSETATTVTCSTYVPEGTVAAFAK